MDSKACYWGAFFFSPIFFISGLASATSVMGSCPATALTADVVAIDHPLVFNRLGAQNVNWMMYALRHDVIDLKTRRVLGYTPDGESLFKKAANKHTSRNIALRPDLRPRPLVLRVAEGGYLKVRFTNLLHVKHVPPRSPQDPFPNQANPFDSYPNPLPGIDHPVEHAAKDTPGTPPEQKIFRLDDQVASRAVGFHPQGLELVTSIGDDSSYVGKNHDSLQAPALARPGHTREYCFFAPREGAYLVSSDGAVFGGEGSSGNSGVGLFGAVTVQPKVARFYRAQLTEEEMRLATTDVTPKGQPIIDYEATYPDDCLNNGIWCREGKAGLPILNMVQNKRIVHGDINAIIVGPGDDGIIGTGDDGKFPKDTYPLEKIGKRNPALPNRLEPFREFVSIFHDENAATQAFPYFFEHPELKHTLHGVRDGFMINYGSGGIGAEIIANRLKAGPMQDCLDCAFEEFFLSSFAVGDPAMLVDKPANLTLSQCQPEFIKMVPDPGDPTGKKEILDPTYATERDKYCTQPKYALHDPRDQRAKKAYYPHDPANVHHSYIGDFVKFRNMHSGKEQHIFHLHNHQWLFNPNDDNSNYIDAQGIGPGSGYTYEIAYGGSGNRNKTVGDAIFHCHFYPHFAQGMWYLWRNHDVFEAGTRLAVSGGTGSDDFHAPDNIFGLMDGTPAAGARALPDGEIVAGTPIPAIVPLPGKGMAVMPLDVRVKPRVGLDGVTYGSVAEVSVPEKTSSHDNPGYPFWVAGVAGLAGMPDEPVSIGSRPTTPPLDMSPLKINGVVVVEGHDGGLRRHALAGYSAGGVTHEKLDRFTAEKHIKKAKPVYYPEEGTILEKLAMVFHEQRIHPTRKVTMSSDVSSAEFITNGAPRVPGAPYNDPCIDDKGKLLTTKDGDGEFFGGSYNSYIHAKDKRFSPHGIEFGSDKPRVYKGANLQLDVVFNKLGYHYPQQRILTLWEDVDPLLSKTRPPEPLVIRMNTFDCAMYAHTNLVPKDFYADDYQITTPTDVIGQHIHLPKWDLTSADGSANGWNYEDGTFSPGMVRERITAINRWNADHKPGTATLIPTVHPYFNSENVPNHQKGFCKEKWEEARGDAHEFDLKWGHPGKCDWFGARTTLQRWFSDPLVNAGGVHRGLGITFTHDHLGPSTHQQLGLYATMLTEPPGSEWRQNETGDKLYTRDDGGPTSWQAVITGKNSKPIDIDDDKRDDSHREFFLQFGDFQHAYQKGAYYGVNKEGVGWPLEPLGAQTAKPTTDSFRLAINPSVRKPARPDVFPDIMQFEPSCPGGPKAPKLPEAVYGSDPANLPPVPPRPCPEAISADDVGMMVVNYRNEPIGARAFDPDKLGPDGNPGMQADGLAGDLAFALQTITSRKCQPMNSADGNDPGPGTPNSNPLCTTTYDMGVQTNIKNTPYEKQTGALAGDPFTPIMRAYSGDLVRVKIQAGSHEHEHNASINGLAWMQGGSGFGQAPHSGGRNAQNAGLSEQFTFAVRITDYETQKKHWNDRMYTIDSSQDGMWNGVWGLLRSLNLRDETFDKLTTLPSNPRPTLLAPDQGAGIDNGCPADARLRKYVVSAVLANQVLNNSLNVTIPPAPAGSNLDPDGGTLVYNPRPTNIRLEMWNETKNQYEIKEYGAGPLHDPTAILFVRDRDLDLYANRLKPGRPVEPLVLRAAAGECIQVYLTNRLPHDRGEMPDLDGYTSLSGIIPRDSGTSSTPVSGSTSFNNNLIRPSNHIGLHPQMVHYDVHAGDGNNIGINTESTIAPGGTKVYTWYAGTVEIVQQKMGEESEEPEEGRICKPLPRGKWDVAYDLLEKFAQPKPRPLSNLITESVFRKELRSILFGQRLDDQTAARMPARQEVDEWRNMREVIDEKIMLNQIVDSTRRSGCLDFIPAESSSATNRIPWTYVAVNDGQAREFDSDNLSDAAPLRNSSVYFDRGDVLLKREACAKLYLDTSKVLTSAYMKARPGRQASSVSKQTLAVSEAERKVLENQSLKVSEIFSFKDNGRDNPKARFAKESTRLAKLSKDARDGCRYVPVEFGGTNLTPPDRIKQGQKGAIGALVIEPQGASWREDDVVIDRQNPGDDQGNTRSTRTTATVRYPVGFGFHKRSFGDLVMIHQKGLNLRYGKYFDNDPTNGAVQNLAAEKEKASEDPGQTAPEDPHDSGHMAINYGTEPMWFRFGLPPDSPFGKQGFGGAASAWEAFSNGCCDNRTPLTGGTVISADQNVGEPYVPIMTVRAGKEMRIRTLMPTGAGRASTVELHGHHWMRDPYLAELTQANGYPMGSRPEDWHAPSYCIGKNALAMSMGGQESVTPMAHFDMVFPRAGGKHRVAGDYLWRDHAGFGITNGLWAIVRVERPWWHWLSGLFSHSLRDSCN